jgi:maltose alpha-D-glucosyltransferase/alpha-amylase
MSADMEALPRAPLTTFADEALWFKDAIIYQLHVRTFADGYQDGIGDFRGLAEKLDYLQDLGITSIWILPFYPSPLKDDGYDISDYTNVHPSYGTLEDVKVFLQEAHRRGLRVVTELVINHTSDQHPWFQRARRAPPGSPERDFYVWSDTAEKFQEARIIFKDFEISNWTWDPLARAYYWHRFYSHQPDLNFDNPAVRQAVIDVVDFWLNLGVDGLRLDAIPYLYEREGTICENLPETHTFLKELRRHVDERFPHRMLLAEANMWPEDAVAYFGCGDEAHMAFHFPLMPRMFMALRMEDRFPIVDILAQTPPVPETCQWALFLRNHDELTLEMVTDEERDYMYRMYAKDKQARINLGIRRRLAPLLENNRHRIELMMGILFSLPGTPVIYYGDEIGMGDNIYLGDRNGVRTPMQWSAERNAGFSHVNPQRLYLPVIVDPEYHYQAINVETQQANPSSLLWWMKRLIAQRKRFRSFGRGSLAFLSPNNPKILAFVRRHGDEVLLVVANLARYPQWAELDLAEFAGLVPVELFARTVFPAIGDGAYFLSLGPYAFYWFSLELAPARPGAPEGKGAEAALPAVTVRTRLDDVFQEPAATALEEILPRYLRARRGFGGKVGQIEHAEIREIIPVPYDTTVAREALIHLTYTEGNPETYILPLGLVSGEESERVLKRTPHAAIARLQGGAEGLLYDVSWEPGFCQALFDLIAENRSVPGWGGMLVARSTPLFAEARGTAHGPLPPLVSKTQQGNTVVTYGDRLILKLFRSVEEGTNPDLELSQFLSVQYRFPHVPPLAGTLEYHTRDREPATVGILQGFVPNAQTAWQYTVNCLSRYFERALASPPLIQELSGLTRTLLAHAELVPPSVASDLFEDYLEAATLLGRRTADLHRALASNTEDPAFAPEAFTEHYRRSIYQSMRSTSSKALHALRRALPNLPEAVRDEAARILERETQLLLYYRAVLNTRTTALRIRCHSDYHLGQLLHTGKDFVIIDFEGDPSRSVTERRLKRCALRDVATMLRSFYCAAWAILLDQTSGLVVRAEDVPRLAPWANFWYLWVGSAFLKSYLATSEGAAHLPRTPQELEVLLGSFLLEHTVHELAFHLLNRPEWVGVSLRGLAPFLDNKEP